MDKRKISVCIPFFRRSDLVMETINPLLNDDRISEIILVDDCSPDEDFKKLLLNVSGISKIKVFKNVVNMYVQQNKHNAISFAKEDWVFCIDNDNVANKDFFDVLFSIKEWKPDTILHPCWAYPHFSYQQFSGRTITKGNVNEFTNDQIFVTLCNTNNYVVHRETYLKCYEYNNDCRGSDGIHNFLKWLKSGNSVYIVPGLIYEHRISIDSAFLSETDSNMKKIYYYLEEIKKLK